MNSSVFANLTKGKPCEAFEYEHSFVIYGLLYPFVAILTVLTNVLVIFVFVKKRMRSPTTVLLIALAVSDSIAGALSVPLYIYLYGFGNYSKKLAYPMCIYHEYSYIMSNIFHTVSAWLTTALAVQRYIVVVHPFSGPRVCTIQKSYIVIAATFLLAPIMYIPSFMYRHYSEVLTIDETGAQSYICTCPLSGLADVYEGALVVMKSLFAKIFPCITLVITTCLLVRKLEIETDRILRLHADDEMEGERRDFRHIRRTSIMVALIVLSFLLVEIPSMVKVIVTQVDDSAIAKQSDYTISMYINFFLLVSYHVNFWIYVSLSEQFRNCLRNICHHTAVRNGSSSARDQSSNHRISTYQVTYLSGTTTM